MGWPWAGVYVDQWWVGGWECGWDDGALGLYGHVPRCSGGAATVGSISRPSRGPTTASTRLSPRRSAAVGRVYHLPDTGGSEVLDIGLMVQSRFTYTGLMNNVGYAVEKSMMINGCTNT